ncbi:MAG: DUF5777 family beta-barrel protein [Bacteroidota bacterium]
MKNKSIKYIKNGTKYLCVLLALVLLNSTIKAQDSTAAAPASNFAKKTFNGNLIIDNQSVMVPVKGVFEFIMQHRFGNVNNGYSDFLGLYASSNIRLGFNYTPIENLQLGFGFTKERMQWDVNLKYALIKQGKTGGSPVSVTYYGLMSVDTRPKKDNFVNDNDRLSYFHQLIFARKISKSISVQVAPSLSWYNNVEGYVSSNGAIKPKMNNAHFALSFMGAYAITDKLSFIVDYDQPLTQHMSDNPNPNVSFGVQMGTATHTFQLFLTNYHSIVPQTNSFFNHNDYTKGMYLIGFNIAKR